MTPGDLRIRQLCWWHQRQVGLVSSGAPGFEPLTYSMRMCTRICSMTTSTRWRSVWTRQSPRQA